MPMYESRTPNSDNLRRQFVSLSEIAEEDPEKIAEYDSGAS